MSKNTVVVCDKCGRETDTFAVVDDVTFCPACVPIEFIKARRVERKEVDNSKRLTSLNARLDKATLEVAKQQARVEKYEAFVLKVDDQRKRAEARAAKIQAEIDKIEAAESKTE